MLVAIKLRNSWPTRLHRQRLPTFMHLHSPLMRTVLPALSALVLIATCIDLDGYRAIRWPQQCYSYHQRSTQESEACAPGLSTPGGGCHLARSARVLEDRLERKTGYAGKWCRSWKRTSLRVNLVNSNPRFLAPLLRVFSEIMTWGSNIHRP